MLHPSLIFTIFLHFLCLIMVKKQVSKSGLDFVKKKTRILCKIYVKMSNRILKILPE